MAAAAPRPERSFALSASIFLRLLAFVHFVAFASAWTQISALVGPHGVSPAAEYFAAARAQLGSRAYLDVPSLCWWLGTDRFLPTLCVLGMLCSVLLFAGVAPAIALLGLWAGYLSLCSAGQQFFAFQWDGLLLEATLIAVFVAPWRWLPGWSAPEPPRLARWLIVWLLFRLMFLAGVVKLASGDPTWRNLTALTFHYETQPLPTPLAWYAQQLPAWWHRIECGVMFVIELGAPFLLFAGRRPRRLGAAILATFMAAISATGNYTFFNALAVVLCLACLDDAFWLRFARAERAVAASLTTDVPDRAASDRAVASVASAAAMDSASPAVSSTHGYPLLAAGPRRHWPDAAEPPGWKRTLLRAFAVFAFAYTGVECVFVVAPALGAPPGFAAIAAVVEPLHSFNSYGLFAVMTHPRTELIFEGSNDGEHWLEYEFPAKPGNLAARPKFVAPQQPRLDWQLWFAALESPDENPWVLTLCERLLRGTPEVLSLLARNPFPRQPPRFIRVRRFEYHFTTAAERRRTGNWWRRTFVDDYVPTATLESPRDSSSPP